MEAVHEENLVKAREVKASRPRRRLEQAKAVAVDCDRLAPGLHGKEEVDQRFRAPTLALPRDRVPR
jgi:hypothetical protein